MDLQEKERTQKTIELTKQLVRFDTVSHRSNENVSLFVKKQLESLQFEVEWHEFTDEKGQKKVSLVAKRGHGRGGIAYLAHTDVVPADDWSFPHCGAFDPIEYHDRLYGRGTCDMKGSLASAIVAASSIEKDSQVAPIYFIVTADEEVGMQGAKQVDKESNFFQEMVDNNTVGIVGEPTLMGVVHAHKGGQRLAVRARGKSAHTSTSEGINANYQLIPALTELLAIRNESESNTVYRNNDFDPPTLSWNMTINNEPQAVNVTPSLAEVNIFIRSMPNVDHAPLIAAIQDVCVRHQLECESSGPGEPWHVPINGDWVLKMLELTDQSHPTTVCYGTDAGVLQRMKKLIVCGPGSIEQAHRCDEWVSIDQLDRAVSIYSKAFQHWACNPT